MATVELDEPVRWKQSLHGIPHGFWHTWSACKAASLSAGSPAFLFVSDTEGDRAVCPVLHRQWNGFSDFTTPIGFSGWACSAGALSRSVLRQWHEFATSKAAVCSYVASHPLYAPPWPLEGETAGDMLYMLELAAEPAAWLNSIDSERRRAIAAWERSRRTWVRDRSLLTAFVVLHHAEFMRSVGASGSSFHTPEALRVLCADSQVELVGVEDPEGLCTVAGFGETPWGCEMIFHISIRAGRRWSSTLIWWAVQHYHSRGVRILNLGGGVRPADSLSFAKRRYRPRELAFRTLKQVFDRSLYQRLCQQVGASAEDRSGYFPAYRARPSGPSPGLTLPRTKP
jgi:hypothetical protein